jgi:hypothetical protein
MDALLLAFLAFGLSAVVAAVFHHVTQGYRDAIGKLTHRNQQMEQKITKLEDAVRGAKVREEILKEKVQELEDQALSRYKEEPGEAGRGSRKKKSSKKESNPVVTALLKAGYVNQDQVAKARKYVQETEAPFPVEEALVMLEYVTKRQLDEARQQAA